MKDVNYLKKSSKRVCLLFIIMIALLTTSIAPQKISATNLTLTDVVEDVFANLDEIKDQSLMDQHKNHVINQLSEGEVVTITDAIDFEEAKLYSLKDTDFTAYSVPVNDLENFHEISNVSFYLDQELNIVHQTELHLKKSNQGMFQITFYLDGEEVANELTDEAFITAQEYQENLNNGGVQLLSWADFAECMGLPSTVAAMVATLCGTVCLVTLGTGCLMCLGGALGVGTGGVAGCAADYLINL